MVINKLDTKLAKPLLAPLEWPSRHYRMFKLLSRKPRVNAPQMGTQCPTQAAHRGRLAPLAQSFALRTPSYAHRHSLNAAAEPDTQSEPPR
ncbi:hypothetical protein QF022_001087 [Vogesella perlucida]|nr:hypothetical protein [Vogesella perlucida]